MMARGILWVLAALATATSTSAQTFEPLLDTGRRDLLHEALSGELAKEHVIEITRHHRIQGDLVGESAGGRSEGRSNNENESEGIAPSHGTA